MEVIKYHIFISVVVIYISVIFLNIVPEDRLEPLKLIINLIGFWQNAWAITDSFYQLISATMLLIN